MAKKKQLFDSPEETSDATAIEQANKEAAAIEEPKGYLEVLKHIRDELEAATNPSLIPDRLHALKVKLHTLVNDLEQE